MTNETAKAIADCQHPDFFNFDPLFKEERFADLQRMAKLWLMRDEILIGLSDTMAYQTIDKIKALEDK